MLHLASLVLKSWVKSPSSVNCVWGDGGGGSEGSDGGYVGLAYGDVGDAGRGYARAGDRALGLGPCSLSRRMQRRMEDGGTGHG
jgi:hypothetical protein